VVPLGFCWHDPSFFFETNQAGADYIKKKISPKWAQRNNNGQQPRRKTNSTKGKEK